MKNVDSNRNTLIPNIVFKTNVRKNGTDKIPENAEFLGRKVIGPFNRNFVIPNEAENMLIKKDMAGKVDISGFAMP